MCIYIYIGYTHIHIIWSIVEYLCFSFYTCNIIENYITHGHKKRTQTDSFNYSIQCNLDFLQLSLHNEN
jgi:hypothetical protein